MLLDSDLTTVALWIVIEVTIDDIWLKKYTFVFAGTKNAMDVINIMVCLNSCLKT